MYTKDTNKWRLLQKRKEKRAVTFFLPNITESIITECFINLNLQATAWVGDQDRHAKWVKNTGTLETWQNLPFPVTATKPEVPESWLTAAFQCSFAYFYTSLWAWSGLVPFSLQWKSQNDNNITAVSQSQICVRLGDVASAEAINKVLLRLGGEAST